MNPAVLLQLIHDLQETVMRLRAENAQLRAQAAAVQQNGAKPVKTGVT